MSELRRRWATAADTDALVVFTADVLRHQDAPAPDACTGAWTRDLMTGRHPRFVPSDFSIVEDVASGEIVSSACLISQTWSFDGIPIAVGQPELIGTHPDRRRQGLVREQFEALHRRSVERGQQLLAIDGVPHFYRQFGYEMALERLGGVVLQAGRLPEVDSPMFSVREAIGADLPFIATAARHAARRSLLTCDRDEGLWQYELYGRDPMNFYRTELRTITTRDGRPVGYLAHAHHTARLAGATLVLYACETLDVDWADVVPTLLAYLRATGLRYASIHGDDFRYVGLWMGTTHPLYAALGQLAPQMAPPYAWYIRVHDLAAFLRHIAPVLERRLAESAWRDFSGELRLGFYRGGVSLVFADGRLASAVPWQQSERLLGVERLQPTTAERADAFLPELTVLQLLCGYRSLDELQHAFPDCLVRTDRVHALLTTLFPRRPSSVWPAV
ncbi:MAG TPA: GNAT family N-acetyltransferase [Candidatus Binatia bacterium]|nr:GNAT family N-acetyltransferase [Candidatus Binatia bacterium]